MTGHVAWFALGAFFIGWGLELAGRAVGKGLVEAAKIIAGSL